MDCEEVKEILDAYALGAAEKEEASQLEAHVAECLRCWEELSDTQRAAAALALGVPLHPASGSLRRRVIAAAASKERWPIRVGSGLRRLGRLPTLAVAGLTALAVGTVALSAVLFVQTSYLQDDRDELRQELTTTRQVADRLSQMEAVRTASDVQSLSLDPAPSQPQAAATFYQSVSTGTAVLVCHNLPTLKAGQVFQVWLLEDGQATAAGSFTPWQGVGYQAIDLESLDEERFDTIGISIEPAAGSDTPTGDLILTGLLPQE